MHSLHCVMDSSSRQPLPHEQPRDCWADSEAEHSKQFVFHTLGMFRLVGKCLKRVFLNACGYTDSSASRRQKENEIHVLCVLRQFEHPFITGRPTAS